MEKLKEVIVRRKTDVFVYRLIKRSDDVAMYGQYYFGNGEIYFNGPHDPDAERLVGFEVFIINKQKDKTDRIGGVTISRKAKELYPRDEDFGLTAYSCATMEMAEMYFDKLTARIAEREKEAV